MTAENQDQMREEFEAWVITQGMEIGRGYTGGAGYGKSAAAAWEAWQAACTKKAEQLSAARKDAARLDYMIGARAMVCHDETCADGYWLDFQKPDGSRWVQIGEFDSPREAIDAAMSSQA